MLKKLKLIVCIVFLLACLAVSQIPTILPVSDVTESIKFLKNVTISGTMQHAKFVVGTEKTDNYTILTSDFGSILVMNAAISKTFALPSVDATNIGSWIIFEKMGAGEVIIDAADLDTVEDSTAGAGIKCSETTTFSRVSLYLRSATSWVIWNAKGTWISF